MADYKKYTDLDVWKEARQLVTFIYSTSKNFPKEELEVILNKLETVRKLLNGIIRYFNASVKQPATDLQPSTYNTQP